MSGILAQVPALSLASFCSLGRSHPSLTPESRAGSSHLPHSTASVTSHPPRHPLGSAFLHPLQNTTSKVLGGTESFFHPFFYQEQGADLLSKNLWRWKMKDHCEHELSAQRIPAGPGPQHPVLAQETCLKCPCPSKINTKGNYV